MRCSFDLKDQILTGENKMKQLISLVAVVLLASSAFANLTGSLTLATDYSNRGVSQTDNDFAVQGSFDYDFNNGFSVGTKMSSVQVGDAYVEYDLYAGYSTSFDAVDVDFSIMRIGYRGGLGSHLEFTGQLNYNSVFAGLTTSQDYSDVDGLNFLYPFAGINFSLADLDLEFKVGQSTVNEDMYYMGEDSYMDFELSTVFDILGFDGKVSFLGTDVEDNDMYEPRFVFSLTANI